MKYIPNLNAELSVLEYRFRNEYENSRLMIISTLDRTKMAYVKGHTRRDVPELGSQRPEVKLSNDEEHFNVGSCTAMPLMKFTPTCANTMMPLIINVNARSTLYFLITRLERES